MTLKTKVCSKNKLLCNINDKCYFLAGGWCTPLIPALRSQRQVDLSEFKASLVYRVNSRTAKATQRNPISKTKQKETKQTLSRQEKPFSRFFGLITIKY